MPITKYGSITSQLPNTSGRIFWVAPATDYTVGGRAYVALDTNDGLSPDKAKRTINDVLDNQVVADANDVIVCLPGAHTPQNEDGTATSLAMDTAGVTLMGLPGGVGNYIRQKATIAQVTGNQNINVTAADIEIAYLNFIPITADSAIDLSAAADRLHIHHCSFDLHTETPSTGTIGIDAIGTASNVLINNCFFECDGAQGPGIVATILDSVIEDCTFTLSAGTWASALTQGAAGRRLIIRRCTFQAGDATYTRCILGTTGGDVSMVMIADCRFADSTNTASEPIHGYDIGDAEIVENYQAQGTSGGTGGTLVLETIA